MSQRLIDRIRTLSPEDVYMVASEISTSYNRVIKSQIVNFSYRKGLQHKLIKSTSNNPFLRDSTNPYKLFELIMKGIEKEIPYAKNLYINTLSPSRASSYSDSLFIEIPRTKKIYRYLCRLQKLLDLAEIALSIRIHYISENGRRAAGLIRDLAFTEVGATGTLMGIAVILDSNVRSPTLIHLRDSTSNPYSISAASMATSYSPILIYEYIPEITKIFKTLIRELI